MAKNLPSGRAKNAVSKSGRMAEIMRVKTPAEKAKAASVVAAIKRHGPKVAMIASTGPAAIARGGVGLTSMAMKAAKAKVTADDISKRVLAKQKTLRMMKEARATVKKAKGK